jgi:hypothetical protein
METLWRDVRQTLLWMTRQKGFRPAGPGVGRHPTAHAPLRGAYFSDVTLESWSRSMRTLQGVTATAMTS